MKLNYTVDTSVIDCTILRLYLHPHSAEDSKRPCLQSGPWPSHTSCVDARRSPLHTTPPLHRAMRQAASVIPRPHPPPRVPCALKALPSPWPRGREGSIAPQSARTLSRLVLQPHLLARPHAPPPPHARYGRVLPPRGSRRRQRSPRPVPDTRPVRRRTAAAAEAAAAVAAAAAARGSLDGVARLAQHQYAPSRPRPRPRRHRGGGHRPGARRVAACRGARVRCRRPRHGPWARGQQQGSSKAGRQAGGRGGAAGGGEAEGTAEAARVRGPRPPRGTGGAARGPAGAPRRRTRAPGGISDRRRLSGPGRAGPGTSLGRVCAGEIGRAHV